MLPVEFPEQNRVWAKDQPPYLPLPAYTDDQQTISCWRLTWRERLRVLFSGRLWLHQLNFSQALQPQKISVRSPFAEAPDPELCALAAALRAAEGGNDGA